MRAWLFLILLGATLAVQAALAWIDRPLKTAAARRGILDLELASSPGRVQDILDSWDARARARAGLSVRLDFLFIPLYAATIAWACLWAGSMLRVHGWWLAAAGAWFAWGLVGAALMDVVENRFLLKILALQVAQPVPLLASSCAWTKFILIGAGVLYVLYGNAALIHMGPRVPPS